MVIPFGILFIVSIFLYPFIALIVIIAFYLEYFCLISIPITFFVGRYIGRYLFYPFIQNLYKKIEKAVK